MKIDPLLHEFAHDTLLGSPPFAKQIEKIGCRYAKPSGCCETLIYIIHKIKNAILSLFGCSDWQRAIRTMQKELFDAKDIRQPQEAKKFVKTLETREFTEEDKAVAIKILNRQISSTIKLFKPYPKLFLDLAVQIQNGKFKDKDADKAYDAYEDHTDPIFTNLENEVQAIEKKVEEEFKKTGLLNLYAAIKQEKKRKKQEREQKKQIA